MKRIVPALALLVALLSACYAGPTEPASEYSAWEYPWVGAPCDHLEPGPSLDQNRLDSIPNPGASRSSDYRWAEIARRVPGGWGGKFSVDNLMTIYLVRPEEADAAIAALLREGAGVGSFPQIWRGRWDFAQLYDWRRYIAQRGLWEIEGLAGVGIRKKDNRIHYAISREGLPQLAALLSELRVPCGLVTATVGPNQHIQVGAD